MIRLGGLLITVLTTALFMFLLCRLSLPIVVIAPAGYLVLGVGVFFSWKAK